MASSWPDCGASVSCSVHRFRLFLEPLSSVVIVTHYATPLRGRPFDRSSLPPRVIFRLLLRPVIFCFMFYVLYFIALSLGLDFYGVCLCWIMDLECLCLVLRLWQLCIVTRLGLRQSSRLSFFPTRRLLRRLLLFHFSSVTVSGRRLLCHLLRRLLRRFHLGISTLASPSVLQTPVLRSSFLALGSRVDSRP